MKSVQVTILAFLFSLIAVLGSNQPPLRLMRVQEPVEKMKSIPISKQPAFPQQLSAEEAKR